MFDIFAKLLSSVATFLFPVFASYKALKTSDPAQLTPWLMYWVVLACVLLAESWVGFVLAWFPFYAWIRAGFLLYLIAPQTQGAKNLYQNYLDPFLLEHEVAIEDFIASAHERAKQAGLSYLKQAVDLLKQHLLGLPPPEPNRPSTPANASYTQSLIARFNLPSGQSTSASHETAGTGATATDFYSLLASAVTAATGTAASQASPRDIAHPATLIPPSVQGSERISFISAQRERLSILISALDKEAMHLDPQSQDDMHKVIPKSIPPTALPGLGEDLHRPASAMSGLSKSRSEADFERIEKEDDATETVERPGQDRQRTGSWLPWSWGAKAQEESAKVDAKMIDTTPEKGKSSGVQL